MEKTVLLVILVLLWLPNCLAQTPSSNPTAQDSLTVKGRLGLMGRWQTGNLNQISIMPSAGISFGKVSYYAAFNASYHYLRVAGFNAINDFWTNGLFQYQPNHRIFPSLHTVMGFAKSYKIDRSLVAGIGGGLNIHRASPSNFFQVHFYAAHLDFKFETEKTHTSIAIGSMLRSILPLNPKIQFRWELSTFHSMKQASFWGGGNLFQLVILTVRNLSINISHQSYYNRKTATDIANTNTEMLFGIQYTFNNN